MGLGVSQYEIDDILEQCDHCGRSFMRSALRSHIKEVETREQDDVDEDAASNDVKAT